MRKLSTLPNTNPDSGDYPFGQIKDQTTEEYGTPVIEATYSDHIQSLYHFLTKAGETPNGLQDNTTNGFQLFRAIEKVLKPIGTIRFSASKTPQEDELLCDGSAYSPTAYPDLYSKIGTIYGGTAGAPRLPNYIDKVIRGGDDDSTLTGGSDTAEAKLPIHSHYNGVGDDDGKAFIYGSSSWGVPGVSTRPILTSSTGGKPRLQGETSTVGSNSPINTLPAYATVYAFIKAKYLG